MKTLLLKSYAKVNIGLRIINKRNDGFHNINSLFQELDFYDTIELKKIHSGCEFNTNVNWLNNNESNLCIKAWKKLSENFSIDGISINLNKKIPPGSGLGGGSSNAATIIKGICNLFQIKLSNEELKQIAMQIGADVPFFINGGLQQATGIGEKLLSISGSIKGTYLLVIPDINISTVWAYDTYDKKFLHLPKDEVKFASFLEGGEEPFKFFENDFESIVVPAYPEIGKVLKILRGRKPKYASLSGSGSTVYGIFDEEAEAKYAESIIPVAYNTYIVKPISTKL